MLLESIAIKMVLPGVFSVVSLGFMFLLGKGVQNFNKFIEQRRDSEKNSSVINNALDQLYQDEKKQAVLENLAVQGIKFAEQSAKSYLETHKEEMANTMKKAIASSFVGDAAKNLFNLSPNSQIIDNTIEAHIAETKKK